MLLAILMQQGGGDRWLWVLITLLILGIVAMLAIGVFRPTSESQENIDAGTKATKEAADTLEDFFKQPFK